MPMKQKPVALVCQYVYDPIQFIMDEIKNTTEAEVKDVVTSESTETQTSVEGVEANATTETTTTIAEPTTKAEVISSLKTIAENGGNVERTELEHLKMLYYRFHNNEVVAARDKYVV